VDKREVVRDARGMMVGLSSAWGIRSRCTLMLCRRLGAVVQMDIAQTLFNTKFKSASNGCM
jgi:hypothetical protein